MAKVSTTLQNIEYIQEQREKREITEKEQREIEKEYNKIIHNTIKYYFIDIFDTCEDIEEQNNNFILDNKIHINNIYQEINEESQKHYKIITNYTWEKGQEDWNRKKEKIYLWDQYDIEHDVFINYFDILKNIYNIYKTETKAKDKKTLEKLEQCFIYNYKQYGYKTASRVFYEYDTIKSVIKEIAINEREAKTIQENYFKILKTIDPIFKKTEEKTPKERKTSGLGLYIGAAIYGLYKGLKNATK